MPLRLESFDVFDTLLTRSVGDPHAVFFRVGCIAERRGIPIGSAAQFKKWRVDAETLSREQCGRGDVTLRQIYDVLRKLAGLTAERARELEELELKVESSGLRPVKVMAQKVAAARTRHGRVAFLSDMYLPGVLIEEKLRNCGLFQNGDKLWVSGERGATKQSGELYRLFLRETGLKPGDVAHCGDNVLSDIKTPHRLGIRAVPFVAARLNRYERMLEEFSGDTGGITSVLAGASRLVRVDHEVAAPHLAEIRNVACGVAGPVLLLYVLWILRQAKEKQSRRIYFLARDGQILLKLAQIVAPFVGYEGDLRYLYASRQALRLPTSNPYDPATLRWAWEGAGFLSLNSFLARLDLTLAQTVDLLAGREFDLAQPDADLDRTSRQKLSGLIEDSRFQKMIASRSASREQALTGYLRQEGFFGSDNFCIVDLGWHGTLQAALECILKKQCAALPTGFYFGLSRRVAKLELHNARAFFFDDGRAQGETARDYWIEPMLEVFCAANHGMTLCYQTGESGFEPVLKEPANRVATEWGLAVQQESILKFARFALESTEIDFAPESCRPALAAILSEFWNRPTASEARAFGTLPYADDQTEAQSRQFGERFSMRDALRSAYRGKITPPHAAGWSAGGLLRSSAFVRWLVPRAVRIGSWWRRKSSAGSDDSAPSTSNAGNSRHLHA